jgi:hypothetical protein
MPTDPMPVEVELDEARTTRLMLACGGVVKAHMREPPFGPEKVFEALNALAVCTASIIHGVAENDGFEDCLQFFLDALSHQLNSFHDQECGRGARNDLN